MSPVQTSTDSEDVALRLRKDRQAFYVKAASAAQSSVKMDTPKPALRPPMHPPGLFHLMACGLLKFDLECGDFRPSRRRLRSGRTTLCSWTGCMRPTVDFALQFIRYTCCSLPLMLCLQCLWTSLVEVVTCSYDFCRCCRHCKGHVGHNCFCNMDLRREL